MVATVTYSLQTIRSQFQANSWIDGNQLAPDVLGLANGGYVVAYNNADINNGYILLDFYDAAGTSLSYSIPYTIDGSGTFDSTDAVGAPSLTQLSNGNVVAVWADPNATSPGIRATIFSEAGAVVEPEFTVTPFSTDRAPQITALENGGFVVTYQISGGTVLAVVYDAGGNVTTGEFVVNTTSGVETEPAITGLADGGFVAVWTYDNGGTLEVRARIFDADGTPRTVDGSTDDFVVGEFGNNSQPAVAALPNGNWAVVYTDSGWADEDVGITLSIFGADGQVVNSFAKVNDQTDPENEFDADITVLANGFIVVSWTYPYNPGVDDDVYFRIFDQNGIPLTIDGYSGVRVLDASFDDDIASAVSAIIAGQFVGAWQDSQTDGSGGQITASVHELVRTTNGDGTDEVLAGDALRDTINGAGGDDTLSGAAADDSLNGGGDNDTLSGGDGNDSLDGGTGNDSLNGGNNNDALVGGAGNDSLNGSSGNDTARYSGAAGGVTVALIAGAQNTGGAGIDTLSSIENLSGSGANDALTGNGGANILTGGNGNDMLNGRDGGDTLNGGSGSDTASYAGAGSFVTVALVAGAQNTGGSGVDTLIGIEHLTGSSHNDSLTGNAVANVLNGSNGNDTLNGGAGNDTLNGGAGVDTASYAGAGAVTVALIAGAQNTGGAGTDTLIDIERLTGSSFADVLTGNAASNILTGGDGNDTLNGRAGNDTLAGGNGVDTASYAGVGAAVTVALIGAAQNTGGAGTDTLSGFENLTGSDFNDRLTGNAANNALTGGDGSDRLVGGLGRDILTGGAGADDFDFNAVNETGTTGATRDQIAGFAPASDDIDLSTIDANTLIAGNQAFMFIGAAAFSGAAGELRSVAGANTIVMGDINGDSAADFHIQLNGNFVLTAASFVL